MITAKEEKTIGKLFDFLEAHPKAVLEIEFDHEERFSAVKEGRYDTDNGLEMDDEGYEEFSAILLERLDNKELIELTYRHFPKCITCNGKFVAGTEQ